MYVFLFCSYDLTLEELTKPCVFAEVKVNDLAAMASL